MSDWLVNAANDLKIDKVDIDIINNQILPKELNIKPLLVYLENLRQIIVKTLENNSIHKDFIVEAKFRVLINENRELICENFVKGENGKIYKTKDFKEKSFEKFSFY
mgnify:FL=1